jgi:hypothetical protein
MSRFKQPLRLCVSLSEHTNEQVIALSARHKLSRSAVFDALVCGMTTAEMDSAVKKGKSILADRRKEYLQERADFMQAVKNAPRDKVLAFAKKVGKK